MTVHIRRASPYPIREELEEHIPIPDAEPKELACAVMLQHIVGYIQEDA